MLPISSKGTFVSRFIGSAARRGRLYCRAQGIASSDRVTRGAAPATFTLLSQPGAAGIDRRAALPSRDNHRRRNRPACAATSLISSVCRLVAPWTTVAPDRYSTVRDGLDVTKQPRLED